MVLWKAHSPAQPLQRLFNSFWSIQEHWGLSREHLWGAFTSSALVFIIWQGSLSDCSHELTPASFSCSPKLSWSDLNLLLNLPLKQDQDPPSLPTEPRNRRAAAVHGNAEPSPSFPPRLAPLLPDENSNLELAFGIKYSCTRLTRWPRAPKASLEWDGVGPEQGTGQGKGRGAGRKAETGTAVWWSAFSGLILIICCILEYNPPQKRKYSRDYTPKMATFFSLFS